MKKSTHTLLIKLNENLELEITGEYTPEEPQTYEYPRDPSEFDITNVEIYKGKLVDLLDFTDEHLSVQIAFTAITKNSSRYETIYEYLAQKCIENIEQ
jgi:hypothetical protein